MTAMQPHHHNHNTATAAPLLDDNNDEAAATAAVVSNGFWSGAPQLQPTKTEKTAAAASAATAGVDGFHEIDLMGGPISAATGAAAEKTTTGAKRCVRVPTYVYYLAYLRIVSRFSSEILTSAWINRKIHN